LNALIVLSVERKCAPSKKKMNPCDSIKKVGKSWQLKRSVPTTALYL
jgi:hypothetical protein